MSDADMVAIRGQTRHVAGLPVGTGAAGGDPGPLTALGVYLGVKAAVAARAGQARRWRASMSRSRASAASAAGSRGGWRRRARG